MPLTNKLQGNVVDICPVGALLDKDFLFKQRVWLLKSVPSVCPGCARGCTISIDQNEDVIYRLKPRFNERVNEWWMCDEGRFGWKYVHRPDRLNMPMIRPGFTAVPVDGPVAGASRAALSPVAWEQLPRLLRAGFAAAGGPLAAVLSPMMSCEEAWLLASFIRNIDPAATLALGYVPVSGEDETFRRGFTIKAEKCPNRRGIEAVLGHFGGPTAAWDVLLKQAETGYFRGVYLVGGYPQAWVGPEVVAALSRVPLLVLHDLFASPLDEWAAVRIPGATWAEREGTFMNADDLLQPFERAIAPLDGVKNDGQFFYELAGEQGLYRSARVRARMADAAPVFAAVHIPRTEPVHAH